jgi:hypothetical protein
MSTRSASHDVIKVTFRSGPSLGHPDRLPLVELGNFLGKLCPQMVRLETVRRRQGAAVSSIHAVFEHSNSSSESAAEYFRQAVTRLEGELDYNASWGEESSASRGEHWMFVEPRIQAAALLSGKPIGLVFEPTGIADSVFELATLNDMEICLGVEVTRTTPDLDLVRALIPALAEVDSISSQAQLSNALSYAISLGKTGGWSAREYFGLPGSAGLFQRMVENSLKESFQKVAPYLTPEFLEFQWTNTPLSDAGSSFAQQICGLRPLNYLMTVFQRLSGLGARLVPRGKLENLLQLGESEARRSEIVCKRAENYVFISYSHRNRGFADALARTLREHNVSYWFDEGIEPGATWDETLETRIRNCGVLIACVSDEYQASKYCRREIKFADLLHKPILPVASEEWSWGEGLQMMFQEYQILNVEAVGGWRKIISGLAGLAPSVMRNQ